MIRPSFCRRATLRRELAKEISLTSLGSSQILRLPHLRTDAARRFWSLRDTIRDRKFKTCENILQARLLKFELIRNTSSLIHPRINSTSRHNYLISRHIDLAYNSSIHKPMRPRPLTQQTRRLLFRLLLYTIASNISANEPPWSRTYPWFYCLC